MTGMKMQLRINDKAGNKFRKKPMARA